MSTTERAIATAIDIRDHMIWISLSDRRVIGMPLDFFPWLESASAAQQSNYEITPISIYWPDLEDGIDMEALIRDSWIK